MPKLTRYFAYLRGVLTLEARTLRANIRLHEEKVERLDRVANAFVGQVKRDAAELGALSKVYEARLLDLLSDTSKSDSLARLGIDGGTELAHDPVRLQKLRLAIQEAKDEHQHLLDAIRHRLTPIECDLADLEADIERLEKVIRDGFLHPGLNHAWRQRYRANLRHGEQAELRINHERPSVARQSDKFERRIGFFDEHVRTQVEPTSAAAIESQPH